MKKSIAFLLFMVGMIFGANAQVVTTSPLFPVDGGGVTVYFHADQGNQGLLNYESGGVFIYTGCVVAGTAGWTHVVTTWGSGSTTYRMTRIDSNTYSYYIPDIRTFYGVTGTTHIDSLCLLFTDSLGDLSGRGVGGADIFYPVIQSGTFEGNFFTPAVTPAIVPPLGTLTSLYGCSESSTISVYLNGILYGTPYLASDSINLTFTGSPAGINWVKAVADNGTTSVADSFYFLQVSSPSTLPLPAGVHDGINYIDDSTATLVLVAPGKKYVFVNGEFNNWILDTSYNMHRTPDSTRWWLTITHLTPGHQYGYQYIVDGSITIADPYAEEILDPYNDPYITASVYPGLKSYPAGQTGYVSILETAKPAYNWTAGSYVKPDEHNLVVYELLVRDFLATHDYQSLKDTLNYLKQLGINAIELMPIAEFEGNISWGYNPDFYFAPDKYYGPADSLRAFIDACHSMNIAVIEDLAMNDVFGSSPLCQLYWDGGNSWPSVDNPWVNTDCDPSTAGYQGKHPDNVGYDFNHESPYTKKLFTDVVRHWVSDYHIDGFRFDLAKGYTQTFTTDVGVWGHYDASRINTWEGYADSMWSADPTTYMILEYFADNDEEIVLANYGLMMWGNMSNAYEQTAMGYATSSADITDISYKSSDLGWNWPNLVGYMESHDEERVMYKVEQYGNSSGAYNIKNLDTGLNRLKLNAAFFFTIPGPKMIWEFEELGYDTSQAADGGNTSPKPILWNYETVPARASVYNVYRQLIYLKTQFPLAFNTDSFTLNVGNTNARSIYLNSATMQADVIGNFDVNSGVVPLYFQHTGWWYEYFTGDSINVTTPYTTAYNFTLNAGEYRLYTSQRITPPATVLNSSLSTPTVNNTNSAPVHLYQNFPNPFSGNSVVDFSLPAAMHANIQIYDITGKQVDVVTDKDYNEGTYTFNLNGGRFTSSGLYYLTLTTSDGSKQTITISVVK